MKNYKEKIMAGIKEKLIDVMIWIKVQPHEDYTDAIINLCSVALDTYRTSILKEIEEKLNDLVNYPNKMIEISGGQLPWVIFKGQMNEKEKIKVYKVAFEDCLKLVKFTLLNNKRQ